MQDFLALLATVPGDVTLEVFAKKVDMTKMAMREELLLNAPLRAYFVQMMRVGMSAVPA
jgi:hypothetical protein